MSYESFKNALSYITVPSSSTIIERSDNRCYDLSQCVCIDHTVKHSRYSRNAANLQRLNQVYIKLAKTHGAISCTDNRYFANATLVINFR
jgi:hypothetical protein